MKELLAFLTVFIVSWIGVGAFRRWSLKKQLLDIPNERSSHTNPTPRGGGLIVVVVSLISYILYSLAMGQRLMWGYLAGALLIAIVSWIDDIRSISFVVRFLVHALAAIALLYDTGAWQSIYFPVFGFKVEVAYVVPFISFCWIVWLTNAYNFMDGIDGISGVQALAAGLGWLLIGYLTGFSNISFFGGVIAFSALGFLIYNWPPAKIFLGDVGSAFLGFTFAAMPFLAGSEHTGKAAPLPIIAVLLVWLFLFDTLLTFFVRIAKGQKVWNAHREHLYQRLIISGYSHRTVSLLYLAISITIVLLLIPALGLRGWFEIALFAFVVLVTIGLTAFAYTRKMLT